MADKAIQIPLIDVTPEPVTLPPVPTTVYLVAAYRPGWGWRIHRDTYNDEHGTKESAEKHALSLSAFWTHRYILVIPLGEQAAPVSPGVRGVGPKELEDRPDGGGSGAGDLEQG